ncbi:MAG: hypothetical protein U9N60_11760 [Thermodesulfobacteriota bacterium]|nr:hypothetical protein [Thermodesulfobacteriota bacterium]
MIQDYANRYSFVMGERQKVSARDKTDSNLHGLFWKVSGVTVIGLLFLGMVFSYWIGGQIRSGLGELTQNRMIHHKISGVKKEMEIHRGNLLALENFEVTAGEFGLYKPTNEQIRYP